MLLNVEAVQANRLLSYACIYRCLLCVVCELAFLHFSALKHYVCV